MVDIGDLKSPGSIAVLVQVQFRAPYHIFLCKCRPYLSTRSNRAFYFLNHPRSANDSQQISMNLWQLDWILDPKTIKTMSFNVSLEHLH